MTCDLGKVIDLSLIPLGLGDIKYIFKEISKGVHQLHQNWIMHRVDSQFIEGSKTTQYFSKPPRRCQNY